MFYFHWYLVDKMMRAPAWLLVPSRRTVWNGVPEEDHDKAGRPAQTEFHRLEIKEYLAKEKEAFDSNQENGGEHEGQGAGGQGPIQCRICPPGDPMLPWVHCYTSMSGQITTYWKLSGPSRPRSMKYILCMIHVCVIKCSLVTDNSRVLMILVKPPRWHQWQFRPRRVWQEGGRCQGGGWQAARANQGKPGPSPSQAQSGHCGGGRGRWAWWWGGRGGWRRPTWHRPPASSTDISLVCTAQSQLCFSSLHYPPRKTNTAESEGTKPNVKKLDLQKEIGWSLLNHFNLMQQYLCWVVFSC